MARGRLARCTAVVLVMGSIGCGATSQRRPETGAVPPSAAAEGPVVATVRLPDFGTDVAAGPAGRVWVTMPSGRLVAVDTAAARVAAEVRVDGEPYTLTVTPDGGRVYVADLRGEDVTVVTTADERVSKRIPIGTLRRPSLRPSAAVSPDGSRVFVGDTSRDHLLVIATDTDRIVQDLFLDVHPAGVAASADGKTIWVVGCRLACVDGTLLAVDAASYRITRRIALPSAPSGLVVGPDGRRAYVANGREGTITSVDLATGDARSFPAAELAGIALSPDGLRLYATSFRDGTLAVIATSTEEVVVALPVGRSPRAVAIGADGTRAYLTHSSSLLTIVDVAGRR